MVIQIKDYESKMSSVKSKSVEHYDCIKDIPNDELYDDNLEEFVGCDILDEYIPDFIDGLIMGTNETVTCFRCDKFETCSRELDDICSVRREEGLVALCKCKWYQDELAQARCSIDDVLRNYGLMDKVKEIKDYCNKQEE
jgi:hypothetical protein